MNKVIDFNEKRLEKARKILKQPQSDRTLMEYIPSSDEEYEVNRVIRAEELTTWNNK